MNRRLRLSLTGLGVLLLIGSIAYCVVTQIGGGLLFRQLNGVPWIANEWHSEPSAWIDNAGRFHLAVRNYGNTLKVYHTDDPDLASLTVDNAACGPANMDLPNATPPHQNGYVYLLYCLSPQQGDIRAARTLATDGTQYEAVSGGNVIVAQSATQSSYWSRLFNTSTAWDTENPNLLHIWVEACPATSFNVSSWGIVYTNATLSEDGLTLTENVAARSATRVIRGNAFRPVFIPSENAMMGIVFRFSLDGRMDTNPLGPFEFCNVGAVLLDTTKSFSDPASYRMGEFTLDGIDDSYGDTEMVELPAKYTNRVALIHIGEHVVAPGTTHNTVRLWQSAVTLESLYRRVAFGLSSSAQGVTFGGCTIH